MRLVPDHPALFVGHKIDAAAGEDKKEDRQRPFVHGYKTLWTARNCRLGFYFLPALFAEGIGFIGVVC